MSGNIRVELTDAEWMLLIDGTRPGGLGKCCGNISDLRDQVISIARDGGEIMSFDAQFFLRSYRAAADGHDLSALPWLMRIRNACLSCMSMTLEELMAAPHQDPHYREAP